MFLRGFLKSSPEAAVTGPSSNTQGSVLTWCEHRGSVGTLTVLPQRSGPESEKALNLLGIVEVASFCDVQRILDGGEKI